MEKIDWSKAPEGYPVYIKGIDLNYASGWYKELDDRYVSERGIYYMKRDSGIFTAYRSPSPAWSGEGLPPVGVVCELHIKDDRWETCEVIAHDQQDGERVAVVRYGAGYYGGDTECLRPIRTPEQIAADERDAAVGEMLGLFGGTDSRDTYLMQRLYDAGYRKQADQ